MTVTLRDADIWLHDFLQVKSVQIQRAGEVKIERVLQGSEQLSFVLPLADPKLGFIHEDQLVLSEGIYWLVDRFEEEHPGHRTVICNARWIELSWRTRVGVFSLLGRTPTQGLTTILSGTGWVVGSMPADLDLYSMEEMDGTALSLLRRWAVVTGYEVEFDTVSRSVSFVESVGEARQIGFRWGQNIKSIKRTFYPPPATRIYPVGANSMSITNVNPTGQPYIEDYSFYMAQGLTLVQARNLYRKDLIWVDERYLVEVNLYDAAVRRLAKLSQPRVFYEADVLDLSRLMGSDQGFNPGDTMPVDDEVLGVLETVRVMRTVQFPTEPKKDKVELGFLSNGMLDVSSGSTRDVDYAGLIPIVSQNDELLTVGGSEVNYGSIAVTSAGSTVLIAGSTFVGTATGTGTVRIRMVIDGTDVGSAREFAFTAGQVEMSWPTFATDLEEGAHDVQWRAQVVSGTGTIELPIGSGRSWLLIRGAVGIGVSTSPNQFVSEEILEVMIDAALEFGWSDDWTEDITDSDDVEDGNFTESETLPEFDDTDLPADFVEWEEEFTVEQEFAFGVFWRDHTPEVYEELADEITSNVPATSQEDDLIVVFLFHRSGAENITAPAGFTRIAQAYVDDGTFEQWSEVWTRDDDGTYAGDPLTFEATTLDRMGMMVAIIRNAEGGTVDVDVVDDSGEYTATFTNPGQEPFPDVVVTEAYRLGVFFVSCAYAPAPPTTVTYEIGFFVPVNDVAPVASSTDDTSFFGELSCTEGDWTGASASFAYRWYFVDDNVTLPGDANDPTYTPDFADHGEFAARAVGGLVEVACEVTAVNVHGSTTVSSNILEVPLFADIASGGTIEWDGTWFTHTFLTDDDFVLLEPGSLDVEYMGVGGGAGSTGGVSGVNYGSGGAGGTVRTGTTTITDEITAITIGLGGTSGTAGAGGAAGGNGGDTVIGTIATAPGGQGVAPSSRTGGANADFTGDTNASSTNSGGGAGGAENGGTDGASHGGDGVEWPTGSGNYYGPGGAGVVSGVRQAAGQGQVHNTSPGVVAPGAEGIGGGASGASAGITSGSTGGAGRAMIRYRPEDWTPAP